MKATPHSSPSAKGNRLSLRRLARNSPITTMSNRPMDSRAVVPQPLGRGVAPSSEHRHRHGDPAVARLQPPPDERRAADGAVVTERRHVVAAAGGRGVVAARGGSGRRRVAAAVGRRRAAAGRDLMQQYGEVECLLRVPLVDAAALQKARDRVSALAFDARLTELAAESGALKGTIFQDLLAALREAARATRRSTSRSASARARSPSSSGSTSRSGRACRQLRNSAAQFWRPILTAPPRSTAGPGRRAAQPRAHQGRRRQRPQGGEPRAADVLRLLRRPHARGGGAGHRRLRPAQDAVRRRVVRSIVFTQPGRAAARAHTHGLERP